MKSGDEQHCSQGLDRDAGFMRAAMKLADRACHEGEVPVGALLVFEGMIVGQGWNRPIGRSDPTAHAEIIALRTAARKLRNYRLPGSTLYVTLEPCIMCAGALVHARVQRLVYGARDARRGAAGSAFDLLSSNFLNHHVEARGGVLGECCSEQLRAFFRTRR